MKHLRFSSAAPRRPVARAVRRTLAAPAFFAAALVAACGGDGPTNPGSATSVRLDVTAQTALATGTTGATVRVAPTYERASGERVALAVQTANLSGAASQTLPFTFDLAPCFADAARRGADQGSGANAVCTVNAAVTVVAGGRTLDSASVGPFTLRGGTSASATVSFTEVSSVAVTRAGGAAVGTQPVPLIGGQTLALAATALGPSGATLPRAVQWTTSAPAVATVNEAGVVTAVGLGTARITASAGGRETVVEVAVQPTLTVTVAGVGQGSVTGGPNGTSCIGTGTVCTLPGALGSTVTLTATPDANSTFTGWTGACTGTGTCTVTLDQLRAVTATFGRRAVAVTVTVSGPGAGALLVTGTGVTNGTCTLPAGQSSVTCTVNAEAGRQITLNAQPATGSSAGVWGGQCTGAAAQACLLTPTADANVTLTFTLRESLTLNITSSTPGTFGGLLQVTGRVNGQPAGQNTPFDVTNGDNIPGLIFDKDSPITVAFQPNAASRAVAWGGACSGATVNANPGGTSTCTFTLSSTSTVGLVLGPR